MDLITLLKKLKDITADQKYAERSRHIILSTAKNNGAPVYRSIPFLQILRSSFETGSTIVLAGVLIVLILGGFRAATKTPTPLASLDAAGLTAEAEAIDIHIKLTELYLADFPENATNTNATGHAPKVAPEKNTTEKNSAIETTIPSLSIDEVLDALSQ